MPIPAHRALLLCAAVAALTGCANPQPTSPGAQSAEEPHIRIVFTGQSLIKHDPRRYVQDPLASVRARIAGADVAFTNLEVAINTADRRCPATKEGIFFHSGSYDVVEFLADIGVDLVSLANNHSWDLGACGVLATINAARTAGMAPAGTGSTLDEALQPAIVEVNGLRAALVAVATTRLPPEAAARPSGPGVNMLAVADEEAWARNIDAIRAARRQADIVIAYQHYQIRDGEDFQQRWARAAIDAGASIYVSHGHPELAGVEPYGGGLILYNLGNFVFHTRTEVGYYEPKTWRSVIAEVTADAAGLREVVFTPLLLNEIGAEQNFLETRGLPEIAAGEEAASILSALKSLSGPHGDRIVIDGEQARLTLRP